MIFFQFFLNTFSSYQTENYEGALHDEECRANFDDVLLIQGYKYINKNT